MYGFCLASHESTYHDCGCVNQDYEYSLILYSVQFSNALSLVPRPFWEGETAWQLPRVQTVTSAARELEDPIRFQIAVT